MIQSGHKVLMSVEGHEAPDRTLLCMSTGSLVVYIRPTYCLGKKSWYESALVNKVNCLKVDSNVAEIANVLKFIKENDELCSEIAERGYRLSRALLNSGARESYMLNLANEIIANDTDVKMEIADVLTWRMEPQGDSHLTYIDIPNEFLHGRATLIGGPRFSVADIEADVGCGVTLYAASNAALLAFKENANTLKMGDDCHESLDDITEDSKGRFEKALVSVNNYDKTKVNEHMLKLGTLGKGNHFVEMLVLEDKNYLAVHTGSRDCLGLLSISKTRAKDKMAPEEVYIALAFLEEVAKINRSEIASHFSCFDEVEDATHVRLATNEESSFCKLGEGKWMIHNMVPSRGKTLLMGSPGSGIALLNCSPGLQPHGTGMKGNRPRPLTNISRSRHYKTVMHVSNKRLT